MRRRLTSALMRSLSQSNIPPFVHAGVFMGDGQTPMKPRGLAIAVMSSLALAAGAFAVRAETPQLQLASSSDFATPSSMGGVPAAPGRTLEWDASKGRWGLKLDVESHSLDRDLELKDISPGVYYRLTRRLHIGGAVSLAPDQTETMRLGQPQLPAPRVRLETTFKF
jgi:hypothetical protein